MTQTPPRVSAQELTELQMSAKAQLVRAIAALNQLSLRRCALNQTFIVPRLSAIKRMRRAHSCLLCPFCPIFWIYR